MAVLILTAFALRGASAHSPISIMSYMHACAERTGLSDEDLSKRYRKHLTSYLKDQLADSERDQSTL